MTLEKPFSQACENNQGPILKHLQGLFCDVAKVLEIGSGTGQHAVYFARHLPHLQWQCSDLKARHAGIEQWRRDSGLSNVLAPLELDVQKPWPAAGDIDAAFSANTAHILPWPAVEAMFTGLGERLADGRYFVLYGPVNYHGRFTSLSNADFNAHLKRQAPHQGIRDLHSELLPLARRCAFTLAEDVPMPANNRLLVWQKSAPPLTS